MTLTETKTVGEIVANDYRAAAVFEKYGIDFCCKGGRTLSEVCEKKNIEKTTLLDKLNSVLNAPQSGQTDYQSWPLDLLADYIEKKHHRYVEATIPVLEKYLDKLCRVHGSHNPELFDIHTLFNQASEELTIHMKKEELILFPYIKELEKMQGESKSVHVPHFGSVKNPIQMMLKEHDMVGEWLHKIAEISGNYNPPAHACNTYRVTYSLLKEFEDDLHLHIHLENNILFPKAITLEEKLS